MNKNKKQDAVLFSNNLNKIPFSQLNEVERELVMYLLIQVKEKGADVIEIKAEVLKAMLSHFTEAEFKLLIQGLKQHFFNLDFAIVAELEDGGVEEDFHHLFNCFMIAYKDKGKTTIRSIKLQVNRPFLYIVNDVVKCFTTFELREFCAVHGKYAKDIYRLLKQYKHTGEAYFDWQYFLALLGISDKSNKYIETEILKKAIKELSRPLEFDSPPRPAFRNLTYEKIREEHTRGRPIKAIRFTFEPERKKPRKTPKAAAPKAQGGRTLFTAEKQGRRGSN